ncbi:hypothetical protein GLOIN_2v1764928 [Rhizophagus irregularis DAOM 181602=DAOM 197198]|uniref:Uncharacterized protein n=1 Tax=Rhizophagus irregularis (strain DAOM 181602 / DAOM 197198 / MUCL 43194) TaxID=747089 RepID=A0A2P4QRD7_RHIID|nr:hypothetical protein GLOIN_2v1764928 [Rhizophagus irregularis DAOM 181602=DAOM 197198]POG80138.1 hypothetical protein GLOIN_2v1764928 [Rhizophagus irregularis DAOM 181602=DAOM 197198]|eukprot:XP_025187004.1 hypothetical protein GLOIN_2v1764928 [Rhizophagus irregularis DAOM 181602=DAOM 197198]
MFVWKIGSYLDTEFQRNLAPSEIGSNLDTRIPQEISSDMDAKISSVRFRDEFNMAFRRFKTSSKYNRGLGHGMVDGFHFGLMDRISPFDFLLDGFPLTNWDKFQVSHPSDFIGWADFLLRTLLDGRISPSDFIRSGEDDGWMMDGEWCI